MVLILAGVILLLLYSCNAYREITKKPPMTLRDSARLSTRYKTTFPEKIASTKTKDTTVTVLKPAQPKVPDFKGVDAGTIQGGGRVGYPLFYDEKGVLRENVPELKVYGGGVDTPMPSGKYKGQWLAPLMRTSRDVMETFYRKGFFDGRESLVPDTLEITRTITNDIKTTDRSELVIANQNTAIQEKRAEKAEGKWKSWKTIGYSLMGFILALFLFMYFILKRKGK